MSTNTTNRCQFSREHYYVWNGAHFFIIKIQFITHERKTQTWKRQTWKYLCLWVLGWSSFVLVQYWPEVTWQGRRKAQPGEITSAPLLYCIRRKEGKIQSFQIFKKRNVWKAPDGNERRRNTDEVMRLWSGDNRNNEKVWRYFIVGVHVARTCVRILWLNLPQKWWILTGCGNFSAVDLIGFMRLLFKARRIMIYNNFHLCTSVLFCLFHSKSNDLSNYDLHHVEIRYV